MPMPNIIRTLTIGVLLSSLAACGSKEDAPKQTNDGITAQRVYAPTLYHDIKLKLNPSSNSFTATDTLTIPATLAQESVSFKLAAGLDVSIQSGAELRLKTENSLAGDVGMDRDNHKLTANTYEINGLTAGQENTAVLTISGEMNYPITEVGDEYGRGFSVTPGLIEERGVYLSGASYWVPTMDDVLVTYDLDIELPSGWQSVSQGVQDENKWRVATPAEEIYVIAAPFKSYEQPAGDVNIQAFLRTPDPAMAKKYLDTTGQYMDMYTELLGPYPYSKFALVENFWETGYGMPSFTLLGSEIIRFPFILHSSYPHELLHNWWGNSVYIDFETGNWAEGLTAYLADHLVAEGRGTGGAYRRAALQRYTNYVDEASDFPLKDFTSRTDPATEAIGYGKTAMVFDMLRTQVGDKVFVQSLQTFYTDNKFKTASWTDIRAAFETTSGEDLEPFFAQWVDGTGAPQLAIDSAVPEGKRLSLTINQTQNGGTYELNIPVAIYTKDSVTRHVIPMSGHRVIAKLDTKGEVVRVEVDPEFNLFRRLHWAEIPPSLGQAFGAQEILIILPSQTSPALSLRYSKLAARWSGRENIKIINDSDISILPETGAIWIFGHNNKFYGAAAHGLRGYDANIQDGQFRVATQSVSLKNHSSIIAVRHPKNPQTVVVGVTAHSDTAVAGLARKLPHYGKYSYLAFTGDDPTNVMKGQWPAIGSPLVAVLDETVTPTAKLTPRVALAKLKPLFDQERMMSIVNELAQPKYEGRGAGTEGLDLAADYIAAEFKKAGVLPGGDAGYFQKFAMEGPSGKQTEVKNVIGIIQGTNPKFAGQSVVLTAHYDHLGFGWPDVRAAHKGQLHPGADDNASGTSVLIEMAYALGKSAPQRTIILLAPAGEEAGLLGARHYVKTAKDYPADKMFANVNLDAVGNAGEKIMVFGSDSAREWPFIFMGTEATTGVKTTLPSQKINASDHTAFLEAGIPAVHIFGAPTMDYHKPSDTADKIDADSLLRTAILTKETVEYLGGRQDPMTVQISVDGNTTPPAKSKPSRRASTGTMPDFAYEGTGVKIAKVTPGSAGAKAGLKDGDVITALGGEIVTDLRQYSAALKQYAPGDSVDIMIERGGEALEFTLTLGAR